MYVGVRDVEQVIDWFQRPGIKESVLCLLLPSGQRDAALLGEIFDKRQFINDRLGDEVAFFLFGHEREDERVIALYNGRGEGYVVPGLAAAASVPASSGGDWLEWKPMPVDYLDADAKRSVVQHSKAATAQLRSHFDLAADDLPCVVFLTRGNSLPFTVRTHDALDVKTLLRFFKELGAVATAVRYSTSLMLPIAVAQNQARVLERDQALAARQEVASRLSQDLEALQDELHRIGLDRWADGLTVEDAHRIFELLGLRRDKPARDQPEPTEIARVQHLLESDVQARDLFRHVRNDGVKYQKNERNIKRLTTELENAVRHWPLNPAGARRDLQSIEERLEAICADFESSLRRRATVLPLMSFLRNVTGAAKAAKDATSVIEHADFVAKKLNP